MRTEKTSETVVPGLHCVADEIHRARHLTKGVQMAVSGIDADDDRKALDWMLSIIIDGLETATDMLRKRGVDCDE